METQFTLATITSSTVTIPTGNRFMVSSKSDAKTQQQRTKEVTYLTALKFPPVNTTSVAGILVDEER
jgi:hypothetical protein